MAAVAMAALGRVWQRAAIARHTSSIEDQGRVEAIIATGALDKFNPGERVRLAWKILNKFHAFIMHEI
jgi:hypothetical protein